MFSHIILGTNDIVVSKRFYDPIMNILGYNEGIIDEKGRCFYISPEGVFGLTVPINEEVATHGNGMTIGFKVSSAEMVDQWHNIGILHGGVTCEEPPGVRSSGNRQLYLAYLRDPSGNKLCATYFI